MTALYVFCALIAVLTLLTLLRVGVQVEYSEDGLDVRVKLGPVFLRVFPGRKKGAGLEKTTSDREHGPKKGGSLTAVRQFLPQVAEAAGELKRRITVDELYLDLCWSLPDPAACAVGFGGLNGALGILWPLIEENFRVKEHRIRTAVDFDRGHPTIWLSARLTMRLGQLVSFGLRFAGRIWNISRSQERQKATQPTTQQKEAV